MICRQDLKEPRKRLPRTPPGSHVIFRLGAGRQRPETQTSGITFPQRELADTVGLKLSNEPAAVAIALIEAFLRPVLYGTSASLATPKQSAFLASLGHKPDSSDMPRPVASAWIDHYLSVRTLKSLRELQPKAGDSVRHSKNFVDPSTGEIETVETDVVVSSIGSTGRVYFKGGNSYSGWPTELSRDTSSRSVIIGSKASRGI